MSLFPITNDEDHERALARMEELWAAPSGSSEAAELSAWATLVGKYEAERWPIEPAAPLDVLRSAVEEMGHTQSDLATLLGSRSRASEVLNGKRALTVEMIRAIAGAWHIPVELLVGTA